MSTKCYTNEDESECVHKNINKQKDTNNEAEYEESSLTDEVMSYFNLSNCGKFSLERLDVTYEQACMATQEDEYLADLLETIIEHNDHHKVPLSNEKLLQLVSVIVAETEEEQQ